MEFSNIIQNQRDEILLNNLPIPDGWILNFRKLRKSFYDIFLLGVERKFICITHIVLVFLSSFYGYGDLSFINFNLF